MTNHAKHAGFSRKGRRRRNRRGRWARSGSVIKRLVATGCATLAALPFVLNGPVSATSYDPATDLYSMAAITSTVGAVAWWNAGYTGRGIDVAVIDSGVSPVPGLDGAGKIIYGPDLSLESQAANLRNLDTYGHGTFMAGLIAGHDASLTVPYSSAPASAYRGMAPDARIVSLKVATADGGTDVSQVIAAINWVVQHRNDNGMNIRVLNLSYGTNSGQKFSVDPLAFAVEQAWKKGIVVVASTGNTGFQKGGSAPGVANPSNDPLVLAVGATDSLGTVSLADDIVASFSASGCGATCRNPDVVVPGAHLQGIRVGNSFIDAHNPNGRLDARYMRGSGTSQSAAVMSGAVALILQKYPTATPDMVKNFLKANAFKLTSKAGPTEPQAQGNGEIRLASLLSLAPSSYTQKATNATGSGSLELARGTDHLAAAGVVLTGEVDIFGKPVNTTSLAAAEAAGSTWSGGTWNGSTWSGSTWSGSTWSGSTWSGSTWSGSTWSGSTWSGSTWSGSTWSGSTWSGSSWSGSTWSGNTWATGSWS